MLHVAEAFGQSEAVARVPAVIAGAAIGPALVLATRVLGRSVPAGALAGLAVTTSAELVLRSREVSSLPLVALWLVALTVGIVRCSEQPSRGNAALVASSLALALSTHHAAVFAVIGALVGLRMTRPLPAALRAPLVVGALLGAPALLLAGATLVRDHEARRAAALHPSLAWGSHGTLEMGAHLGSSALASFGVVVVVVAALAAILGARRRDTAVLVPMVAALGAALGIALLAPIARVQAYYLVAALPLVPLSAALATDHGSTTQRPWVGVAVLGAAVAIGTLPRLNEARGGYVPDPDAFMPALVRSIAAQPERRVALVVAYDAPLLAYYLARRRGVEVDASSMHAEADGSVRVDGLAQVLVPLVRSHALEPDPDERARTALLRAIAEGPLLVIAREAFHLDRTSAVLAGCRVLAHEGTGTLYRCAP